MDDATGLYIGICDALKLTARGKTWAELLENSDDIIQLLLTDLLKAGRFPEFLAKHGWSLTGRMPARRADVRFDVPMPFQFDPDRHRALSA